MYPTEEAELGNMRLHRQKCRLGRNNVPLVVLKVGDIEEAVVAAAITAEVVDITAKEGVVVAKVMVDIRINEVEAEEEDSEVMGTRSTTINMTRTPNTIIIVVEAIECRVDGPKEEQEGEVEAVVTTLEDVVDEGEITIAVEIEITTNSRI